MSANVVSLFSPRRVRSWSQQEVAEFFRVRDILAKSGITLDTDQGLSDEGDPWFVFCRSDTGEVVVHFARIDDLYIIGIPGLGDRVLRGLDFRSLIDAFLSGQTDVVVLPQSSDKVRRLVIHPNALLVAFVATVLLLTDGLKTPASAMDLNGDQAAGSPSGRLPFFDWAHYQRVIQRDGGWESERTLAIVVAVIMASIAENHFDLFDKANAAHATNGITILGSAEAQASSDDHSQGRNGTTALTLHDPSLTSGHFDLSAAHGEIPTLRSIVEAELTRMLASEPNEIVDLPQADAKIELSAADRLPNFVEHALQFICSMTQSSPESAHQVCTLALELIRDLVDSHKSPMEVAPEHLVAVINDVIQSSGLVEANTAANSSSFVLDPGAFIIEISGPSTIDAASLFVPQSSSALEPAVDTIGQTSAATAPATFAEGGSAQSIPVVSIQTPVIEIDNISAITASLRSFLAIAEEVDVIVDNDTIVFVDRSDRDDALALQIGSVWTMENDITVMIVGSPDTINAYHDSIEPTA